MRAGLQQWLLGWRLSAAEAVLATAAAFSLLHAASGALAAAGVFLPGLALGMLFQRWRDWRMCAGAHSLMNGFALALCSL